ncbi:hypothetical protein [Xenorhabdus hominickii]|uniref:Lipoprotein n=1 Tax=Xenorhabdus hominickii TaxID=351679 RepID=A0A2G0QDQ4_XENHO|nr:hypothetical protein [Xenorhabdus hominickii]AOM41434.1 hypothetical protein A9255_13090 [Xenorhabdus hominickii]PHM57353.1 hypothetical protein Xhom_00319 [Xenorhabdus hominickii]
MKLTNTNKLLAVTLCLATSYSYADSERPLFSLTMTESGVPQTNNDGSLSRSSKSESRILPIWGNEARAKGYDLPEPFGVSYGYMNLRQDVVVDKIGFIMPKNPSTAEALKIQAGKTRERNESHMLKLDTWVLPFLNVYGVYGKTKGTSATNIENVELGFFKFKNIPFELDFQGKTLGGGLTLAGGYNQFFVTLDANYTRTNLDILDGDITAYVMTPRIGYEFIFEPLFAGQGNTKIQIWAGAMYQDITQRFKGNINNLNLPGVFGVLVKAMDDPDMKFDVEQHLAHKWNNTAGVRIELTRNFNVLSEVGFGNRNSFFISGEFRF